jgi:hypothetical protein
MNIRSEPFLWIHLAGVALFPGLLGITWVGLAIGDSFPYVLELPWLVAIAIVPILLMQLTRPFDIFSVLLFSLKPECLSEEQRKILSLFKTFPQKLLSIIAAVIMMLMLWLLYRLSPLAIGTIDFLPQWRILGLAIATLAFLGSNLFLQVPLSALQVLLTKQADFIKVEPYPLEKIARSFTIPGIKVNKILWFLESAQTEKIN